MVQLTTSGAVVGTSAVDVARLRRHFEREHVLRLPNLLAPAALQLVQRQLDRGTFERKVHEHIGVELCLTRSPAVDLLFFLTNDPKLFALTEQVTACDRIGCFMGRIYRMAPGSGHYDAWHSDVIDRRMIGMSVNLGAELYRGGVFQLRERGSSTLLCEVVNTQPGDAFVFRIATSLEHRITDVEGTVPKTAFAGWFQSQPDFLSLLGAERP